MNRPNILEHCFSSMSIWILQVDRQVDI